MCVARQLPRFFSVFSGDFETSVVAVVTFVNIVIVSVSNRRASRDLQMNSPNFKTINDKLTYFSGWGGCRDKRSRPRSRRRRERGARGGRCRRVGPEQNKMTKVENARAQLATPFLPLHKSPTGLRRSRLPLGFYSEM